MHFGIHFWELACFVTFIALIFKPVKNAIKSSLKDYSNTVKGKISEATALRKEAEKFLQQYQQANTKFTAKSKQILLNTEDNIKILTNESKAKLEEQIETRKKMHVEKIAIGQKDQLLRLKTRAVERAIEICKLHLREHSEKTISSTELNRTLDLIDSKQNT